MLQRACRTSCVQAILASTLCERVIAPAVHDYRTCHKHRQFTFLMPPVGRLHSLVKPTVRGASGSVRPSVCPRTPPAIAESRRRYAMLLSHKTKVTTEGRLAHFLLLRAVLGARVAHMGSAELGRPCSASGLTHGRVARCTIGVSTFSSWKCTCA